MTPEEIQAKRDEAARQLNIADEVIRSAKAENRGFTDDERTRHDEAIRSYELLIDEADKATTEAGDAARIAAHEVRRSRFDVPNINVRGSYSVGAGVTRSLDDMFNATADVVRGSNGVSTVAVDQIITRSSANDAGSPAPRIKAFQPDHRETIRSFQNLVAEMAIVGTLVDEDAKSSSKGFQVARSLPQYKDRWNTILRAMDVDTSSEGIEWVPTGLGAAVHEQVRASGKVAALFDRIDLPTNPWKWPIAGADLTAYRVAEPTSDTATKVTASTAGTNAATFDAEIFGVRTLWSRSLDVDSAVAIAGRMQRQIVQAFVDAEEKAILDGDADGTHQDTDVQALGATDPRSAWDGLRKKALAQTVVTATSTSVANLLLLRKGMGKWGINPADLAYIVGVSAVHALLADSNLLTVDKFGPNATILNGQIGSIAGVPVIASEWVRENLNASGVQDGITTTKTYNLCVNRREWAMGQRMALDFRVSDELYAETFQRVAIAFAREDFQSLATAATNEDTAISYNVTP